MCFCRSQTRSKATINLNSSFLLSPKVNNKLISLPATLEARKIQISQNDGRTILQTDFGLQVTYDEDWAVMVAVPSSYFGVTCGLCGNFNEDTEDETTLPDGTQASSVEDWAESWRDPSCPADCGGQETLQDTAGCGELGLGGSLNILGRKKRIHVGTRPWGAGDLLPSPPMAVGISLVNISSIRGGAWVCWWTTG